MKIKVEWYKPSGKWYETYEVDIPDSLFLWSRELASVINSDRSVWESRAKQGFFLVIDNVELSPEGSNNGKFMKVLWTPDTFLARFDKVDNYVPLPRSLKTAEEEYIERQNKSQREFETRFCRSSFTD